MLRNLFKDLLLIIASATLLCYAAFSNHFPLTFDDTGTYLGSGFKNEVPQDRPIIYGLFMRHISMWESLWLVIFAQGLILAYLLFLCFRHFVSIRLKTFWYLCLVILLTFFTGASINVSLLIPDFFTPVMLLCFALLLSNRLATGEKIFVSVMLVFSIGTHNTHILIGLIAMALYTVAVAVWKVGGTIVTSWKPLAFGWILWLAGVLSIPSVNYLFDGNFTTTKASHIFMMYKLNEMGILDDYLRNNCDTKHWRICKYKDSIPSNFIWGGDKTPVNQEGGWDATRGEYDSIIADIFAHSKYVKWFAEKAASNSMEQLASFAAGVSLPSNIPGSSPYNHIKLFFPGDVRQLELCRQFKGGLNFEWLNNWQMLLVIVSLLCLVFILFYSGEKISSPLARTSLILLLGIFANAVVCGSLSIVDDRYQSRVIWLLPIVVFLLLLEHPTIFSSLRKTFLGKEEIRS